MRTPHVDVHARKSATASIVFFSAFPYVASYRGKENVRLFLVICPLLLLPFSYLTFLFFG